MGGPPRVDTDVTFLELQNDALVALNFSTATTSDPRTRVKRAINQWQKRILRRPGFARLLRDRELSFTSAASTHTYSFPSSVERVIHITDNDANQIKLVRRDLAWLRTHDPGLETLGAPECYIDRGRASSGLLQVQLWPTPQDAYTYTLDYTARITDMTEDAEEPLLPDDFHEILSLGAQYHEWKRADDSRKDEVRIDLEDGLKAMNRWIWDLADQTQERPAGWSQLGAWFPADVRFR
jgi:hypothetical protein